MMNRITIFGPKDDGMYVVEFRAAEDEALAISITRGAAHVIRHFQERMPFGLFVPEVPSEYRIPGPTAAAALPRAAVSVLRDAAP